MIWIRSQDRMALMECNDIQITDNNEIINGNPFDEYSLLGIYKTKQRALEVSLTPRMIILSSSWTQS